MTDELKIQSVHLRFDAELLKRIEDYRWTQRIETRQDAIMRLIEAGLNAEGKKIQK